jgi:hypothetical protein
MTGKRCSVGGEDELIKGEIARISHGCIERSARAKLKSIGKTNTLLYFDFIRKLPISTDGGMRRA